MSSPQPLRVGTVLRWTIGVSLFIAAVTVFWGHGFLIFTPALILVTFRFRLILEPKWDLDAELKAILNGRR